MKIEILKKKKFIESAKTVHSDKYEYSKVRFKSSAEKVKIMCPKHGEFWQSPTQHLLGQGCPYCAHKRLTKEEFYGHMHKLHGDKYDLSKCNYTHKNKLHDKLTITCKTHGDFKKRVTELLKGEGCPKCTRRSRKTSNLPIQKSIEPITIEESMVEEIITFYSVKIQFKPNKSETKVYVRSEPFGNKSEAEELLGNIKMFIEMTDSVLYESSIEEINQNILDSEMAVEFIRKRNLTLEKDYLNWWDKYKPTFIPRNLNEFYPNFNSPFKGKTIKMILSTKSQFERPDNISRRSS